MSPGAVTTKYQGKAMRLNQKTLHTLTVLLSISVLVTAPACAQITIPGVLANVDASLISFKQRRSVLL